MSRQSKKTSKRIDSVYGMVNVTDGAITFKYDYEKDAIEVVGAEAGSTRTERRYERESGKHKIVSSIPSDGSTAFTAERALFAYDRVVAIDTNTRVVEGKRCAVCCSYYVPGAPSSYQNGVPYLPFGAFLIVGVAEGINSEMIGWHLTLNRYIERHRPSQDRLAVVVDSELGRHKAINAREIGYYGKHLLPENTTMVYASSDADKETLQGVMIRMCDKVSNAIVDELLSRGGLPGLPKNGDDKNFEAFVEIKDKNKSRTHPAG